MSTFSERNGYVEPRSIVQLDELDRDTRVRLWNVIEVIIRRPFEKESGYELENGFLDYLWINFLQLPVDERPRATGSAWITVKGNITGAPFNRCMDALENLAAALQNYARFSTRMNSSHNDFVEMVNEVFEICLVGYRFVGNQLLQMDSNAEVATLTSSLGESRLLPVAHAHLEQALSHLADRQNPDYRNSIKESITAVESAVRTLTAEREFSKAMRALPRVGIPAHSALIGSWEKLYGWTSNAGGLRHGSDEIDDVDQGLAKYLFGSCAAFVAYLADKARQAGRK